MHQQGVAGTIVEFSFERGLGVVEDGSGTRYDFHCTAIADGTRDIAVGATVHFDVTAGHHGRWEASNLLPR